MENFFYSINATLPIFFIILTGYILKQRGIFNENFVSISNKFNFNVTLPVLLFKDIASTDFLSVFDLKYIMFCMIVTTICFIGIWGFTKKILKDKSMTGAFVQASFRGSAAVMGIAFMQNIYGDSGMVPLMIIGTVPLYNIYSIIVLSFESGDKENKNIKKTIKNIFKNPIIIGIATGLLASVFGIYKNSPVIITKTVESIGSMASPLALIAIGAGFEGRKVIAKIKPAMAAVFIKLILLPAIFLPIAAAVGFREQKMLALLVMLGAPTTPSCYIMAKSMKNDGVLTSSIIVTSVLISSITLTGWIFILKSCGII